MIRWQIPGHSANLSSILGEISRLTRTAQPVYGWQAATSPPRRRATWKSSPVRWEGRLRQRQHQQPRQRPRERRRHRLPAHLGVHPVRGRLSQLTQPAMSSRLELPAMARLLSRQVAVLRAPQAMVFIGMSQLLTPGPPRRRCQLPNTTLGWLTRPTPTRYMSLADSTRTSLSWPRRKSTILRRTPGQWVHPCRIPLVVISRPQCIIRATVKSMLWVGSMESPSRSKARLESMTRLPIPGILRGHPSLCRWVAPATAL